MLSLVGFEPMTPALQGNRANTAPHRTAVDTVISDWQISTACIGVLPVKTANITMEPDPDVNCV